MVQRIVYGSQARARLLRGVQLLARTVAGTLGPAGRNVILASSHEAPRAVCDGASVAEALTLSHPHENLGVQLLRSAADGDTHDGSTTAMLLAASLLTRAVHLVESGENPVPLADQLRHAGEHAAESLRVASVVLATRSDRMAVAASATHESAMAEHIEKALQHMGADGVVSVQRSSTGQTYVEISDGITLNSPALVQSSPTLSDALVLLSADPLTSADDVTPTLKHAAAERRSVLFVASAVEGEALVVLRANAQRSDLPLAAVRAPEFGLKRHQVLESLASYTGASVISEQLGLTAAEIGSEMLGAASSVQLRADTAVVIGGAGTSESAAAARPVAVLALDAATDPEYAERARRARSAVSALQRALLSGALPGGGVALYQVVTRAMEGIDHHGARLLGRAVRVPLRCIAENAGYSPDEAERAARTGLYGYGLNAVSGAYEDLYASGVMDATETLQHAVLAATSIAATVLTTEMTYVSPLETHAHTHSEHVHTHGGHGHTHRHGPGF